MHDLYTLLRKIQKAPSMYLGQSSISCLQAFISGYNVAKYELGAGESSQDQDFQDFPDWIRQKFNIQTSQSWASVLLFYSEDEQKALDLFFTVFEEFLQRHPATSSSENLSQPQSLAS
jgi:hypothetical protein